MALARHPRAPGADVPAEHARDPVGWLGQDCDESRDRCRTPMPWTGAPGGGFSPAPGASPWLPLGDVAARNVADQRADPGSTLSFVRDLIALRRARADLHRGSYGTVAAGPGPWAWRRGEGHAVALNLGAERAELTGLDGVIALATDRRRDGERVLGGLGLGPYEGVVVELGG